MNDYRSQYYGQRTSSSKTSISSLNLIETPSLDDNVRSVIPSIWGKQLWFSLHFGALNYPLNPTPEMQIMQIGFIKGLPMMIPCDKCKNHSQEYITSRPVEIEYAVTNPYRLFKFFVDFHNYVNKLTNKKEMSLEQAFELYSKNPLKALA